MTIRQDIIDVLIDEELTAEEISKRLNIPKGHINSYVHALKNAGKIEAVDNRKYNKVYSACTPKALLKWLFNHMLKNMRTNDDYDIRKDTKAQKKLLKIEKRFR